MPRERRPQMVLLLLLLLVPLLMGCGGEEKTVPAEKKPAQGSLTQPDSLVADGIVTIKVAGVPARVRVSQTPEEKQRGLMYTEKLPPDQGMLFVFDDEDRRAFWMKNTPIALDIAYIDRMGQIVEIQKMKPLDTTVCVSQRRAMYALEMNAGWFQEHGVTVGDWVAF
jgi:uncharacterized membrane protein (UPF0127 family)